ncbi:hypothetical protein BDA96_06G006900 [Sorghum bicolor]|jgi:hypothetical protein|uniref:rRNA N-glycosidase n=1 Tax=Sorghum bicolor TaxID=4558 RepID=A0A921QQ86_SORBI|nr:hypothetical protein BDA96_06G006900 [Sorghum bicolor]
MEGGPRCSIVLLFLTVALAASSLSWLAQRSLPPAEGRYVLVALQTDRGHQTKLVAVMTDKVSMGGFSNKFGNWFAFPLPLSAAGNSYNDNHGQGGFGNLLSLIVNAAAP